MTTDVAKILASLAEQPGTAYDVHADTEISLKKCCAHLQQLHASGRVVRSEKKVRLRHRSPGAWIYSLPASELSP